MNIDIARAHISEREQQRVRSERIIDIAVCIERALAVAPLAHLEARTIGRADNGERGSAAGAAPTAGDPEHDLKQVNNPTEHPSTQCDTNGQCQDARERIEDGRSRLQNSRHRGSIELGSRTPPDTHYLPLMANRPGAGWTESNRRGAETTRTCTPLHPACHANNEMSRATTYVTIASAAG